MASENRPKGWQAHLIKMAENQDKIKFAEIHLARGIFAYNNPEIPYQIIIFLFHATI